MSATILLVDDHSVVREGYRSVLEKQPGLRVIAEAADGAEAYRLFKSEAPDLVIVSGDVNSTLAAALVAAKLHIRLAHVEAGLRSFDRTMPEEINRVVVDHISQILFATEPSGVTNLLNEGIAAESIHLVGNCMVDSLLAHVEAAIAKGVCYRGKVLSLDAEDDYQGTVNGLKVHRLRKVRREDVILPRPTLELLDRNVIEFVGARQQLRALGMATKKGILFHGPPGTGNRSQFGIHGLIPSQAAAALAAPQHREYPGRQHAAGVTSCKATVSAEMQSAGSISDCSGGLESADAGTPARSAQAMPCRY